jgi:hypothetical protein
MESGHGVAARLRDAARANRHGWPIAFSRRNIATLATLATLATDAPGAAYCSNTIAFGFTLCRRRSEAAVFKESPRINALNLNP